MSCNLLVMSDLHLGEQEPGEGRAELSARVQLRALQWGTFLDYYRKNREGQRPWRLVIGGDTVDFMRLYVPRESGEEGESQFYIPPHTLEGTVKKLDRLFDVHRELLTKLGRFIAEGNQLVLICGNHDGEFQWPEIQDYFRSKLYYLIYREYLGLSRETFYSRIKFFEYSYYEPGRIYMEHGHLYDPYCNTEEVEVEGPEKREIFSFAHLITEMQYQRPDVFRGIPLDRFDEWGLREIFSWTFQKPFKQVLIVLMNYFILSWRLIKIAWSREFRKIWSLPPEERQRALDSFANRRNLPSEILEPLGKFVTPPLYYNFFDAIQAIYLDRLLLIVMTSFLLSIAFTSSWHPIVRAALATATSAGFVWGFIYLSRRRPLSQSAPLLFHTAIKLAAFLSTPLIVFGHSHNFTCKPLNQDQFYINLGAWQLHPALIQSFLDGNTAPLHQFNYPYLKIVAGPDKDQFFLYWWKLSSQSPRDNYCILFPPAETPSREHQIVPEKKLETIE